PERGRKGAEAAGVLVEIEVASPTRLPLDANDFDIAVVDDTDGLFGTMRAEDRVTAIRELHRVLRPGGRVILLGAVPRGGIGGILTRTTIASFAASSLAKTALQAEGFRSARTL